MSSEKIKITSKLAEYRNKKGYSQEDLARAIGVSKTTIQSWENQRGMTSVMRILKLCRELDADVRDLFPVES
ncbi:MAG: helix-turn-helix transcriptional regulator [Xenococcus sp. (in: cyanobacteria)]|nr:helix-turn-helix transcriptional regulator [Xenococcaceae cyanobacterium MO_167.B52]